ncbi:MAG: hypothetical protein K2G03_03385 [Bacilli bacterium]|nr:hypothetical protein [Bacilli bacterium]
MKVIKQQHKLPILLLVVLFLVTGCAFDTDADIASYNVSKEADQFRVKRRIVFVNLRSDTYLYVITGNCSIETDNSDNQLEVICKVGEDKYQKHFLYLSDETTYTVEQLDYSEVSKYDYEIIFKPESIVPIKIEVE